MLAGTGNRQLAGDKLTGSILGPPCCLATVGQQTAEMRHASGPCRGLQGQTCASRYPGTRSRQPPAGHAQTRHPNHSHTRGKQRAGLKNGRNDEPGQRTGQTTNHPAHPGLRVCEVRLEHSDAMLRV